MTRARLKPADVYTAIANRTGLPVSMTRKMLDIYADIVKEAILADVEVPLPGLCIFKWKTVAPKEKAHHWDYQRQELVEEKNVPGYRKMSIPPAPGWRKALKEATEFYENDTSNYNKEEENDEIQDNDDNE